MIFQCILTFSLISSQDLLIFKRTTKALQNRPPLNIIRIWRSTRTTHPERIFRVTLWKEDLRKWQSDKMIIFSLDSRSVTSSRLREVIKSMGAPVTWSSAPMEPSCISCIWEAYRFTPRVPQCLAWSWSMIWLISVGRGLLAWVRGGYKMVLSL